MVNPPHVGRPGTTSIALLEAITAAGAAGIGTLELTLAAGVSQRHVNSTLRNMRQRQGTIYSLGDNKARNEIRHFAASVPLRKAQAVVDKAKEAHRIAVAAARRKSNKESNALQRAMRISDEAALAEIALIRQVRAEERMEAAKARQDALTAARNAKPKPGPSVRLQRDTAKINALADKVRGTVSVSALPKRAPRFVGVQDIPEHLIYRAPPKLGRYEVLTATPLFGALRPGQYASDAESCAARAVAA